MTLGPESGLKNPVAHLHKNMDLENFQKMDAAGAVQLDLEWLWWRMLYTNRIENRGQSLQRGAQSKETIARSCQGTEIAKFTTVPTCM